MCNFRKVMAVLLVLAMSLSLVFSASAATTSPSTAPTTNTEFDTKTGIDNNKQNHTEGTEVDTVVEATGATTIKVTTTNDRFVLGNARDAQNVEKPITQIGDGTKGILADGGESALYVTVQSTAPEVVIASNAFAGSNLKRLTLKSKNVKIQKGAFSGSKRKNTVIRVTGAKKAKQLSVAKGAFAGLNKKAKISVGKQMSKKEFKKLKKALKKAGFKGKIVRG